MLKYNANTILKVARTRVHIICMYLHLIITWSLYEQMNEKTAKRKKEVYAWHIIATRLTKEAPKIIPVIVSVSLMLNFFLFNTIQVNDHEIILIPMYLFINLYYYYFGERRDHHRQLDSFISFSLLIFIA